MSNIYEGQTDLLIQVTVNQNLSGATITKIAYRNPLGVIGSFNATLSNPTLGILTYPAINNELDVLGNWTFWPDITLSNGLRTIGTPFTARIRRQGTN